MPRKPAKQDPADPPRDFNTLVESIQQAHDHSAALVNRVVNTSLTLRNWVIGAYIDEYELRGEDRARYGESLLKELAKRLSSEKISNCNRRQLYRYLRFFRLYPEIVGTVSPQLGTIDDGRGFLRALQDKVGTASPQLGAAPQDLAERLSYSHLELIVDLDDPLKRAFYEIESSGETGRCVRSSARSPHSTSSAPASR